MPESKITDADPVLLAACVTAATSIAIARGLHAGAELEKFIAERAYKIYEATATRFGLARSAPGAAASRPEPAAGAGAPAWHTRPAAVNKSLS